SGSFNINGAANAGTSFSMTSITTTQLTFTVTSSSSGGTLSKMTWQNVRVRPTAGTPLASGNLRESGTAIVLSLSTNSNLGALREVAGAANKLAIQTHPSATALAFTTQPGNATAGSIFGVQPVVSSQDAFGNNSVVGLPASVNVNISLSAGTGPLQGTTTLDIGAGNGTISFSDLRIDAAGAGKQLSVSAGGLSSGSSATFTVSPSATTSLAIQTQPPATATAGATFSPAPVVRLLDSFGNLVTTDSSTVVTATRN